MIARPLSMAWYGSCTISSLCGTCSILTNVESVFEPQGFCQTPAPYEGSCFWYRVWVSEQCTVDTALLGWSVVGQYLDDGLLWRHLSNYTTKPTHKKPSAQSTIPWIEMVSVLENFLTATPPIFRPLAELKRWRCETRSIYHEGRDLLEIQYTKIHRRGPSIYISLVSLLFTPSSLSSFTLIYNTNTFSIKLKL